MHSGKVDEQEEGRSGQLLEAEACVSARARRIETLEACYWCWSRERKRARAVEAEEAVEAVATKAGSAAGDAGAAYQHARTYLAKRLRHCLLRPGKEGDAPHRTQCSSALSVVVSETSA